MSQLPPLSVASPGTSYVATIETMLSTRSSSTCGSPTNFAPEYRACMASPNNLSNCPAGKCSRMTRMTSALTPFQVCRVCNDPSGPSFGRAAISERSLRANSNALGLAFVSLAHAIEPAVLSQTRRIEIEGFAVHIGPDDHMIEGQRTGKEFLGALAPQRIEQHRFAPDTQRLQQGYQQKRLVLAVSVASLQDNVRRGRPMRTFTERH